jgi:septum formation protein
MGHRLILASASPRRRGLLLEAGYDFLVEPAEVDERAIGEGLAAGEAAERIARAKAEAVARRFPDDVVLAADTVVAARGMTLGKAADEAEARRILSLLSGTTHEVITGVAVLHLRAGLSLVERVISTVEMKTLSAAEIDAYIASGDWRGKAGAYGIQDSDSFVRRTAGCLTNIVGLPMTTTAMVLSRAGVVAATT